MIATVPVVSVADGPSAFWPDEKLAAVSVTRKLGKSGGSAQVSVLVHQGFTLKDALDRYAGIDKYIIIATPEKSIFSKSLLFMGRIVRPGLAITVSEDQSQESITLDCEHVCEELKNIILDGRYVGATPTSIGKPKAIPIPPIFNFRGLPNKAPKAADGKHIHVSMDLPVFASGIDGTDKNAEFWTFGGIFLYLIGWYCSDEATRQYPFVNFSDFVRTCMDCYKAKPGGRGVKYYLSQRAPEMNFENMNVLDAIEKLCNVAGIEYAYRAAYINGRPSFVFDGWAPGTGREMTVQMEERMRDVVAEGWPDEDAEETLEKNNVNQMRVTYDASQVITAVKVTGAPKRVEFTAELVPGWPQDGTLNNVSDITYAKKRAIKHLGLDGDELKSDFWYLAYVASSPTTIKSGLQYGRYWVLNEDGAFSGREAFDVAKQLAGTDKKYTVKRPRKLLPCLSKDAQGKSLGVYVEASFDSGGTWQPMSGVRVLEDRCGIELTTDDLTKLLPPGVDDPSVNNAWYALLDGKFKVRVTACLELDTCLEATATLTSGTQRWLKIKDANLRYWQKKTSQVSAASAEEYDDANAAREKAWAVLNRSSQWQIPSELTIPWFETDYVIGDMITQIDGRDIPLKMSLGEIESSPIVVGLTWLFGKEYCTKLILQDDRLSSDVI